MKLVLDIKTHEDIKNIREGITMLRLQLTQFQAITIRKLANIVIVDTIHNRMRAENFSDKIINNTILSNIEIKSANVVTLHFTSTYFSETGFDVALAREKGTKDHDVPKNPIPPTEDRPNPSLKIMTDGKVSFYKKTHPKGMKALHIIEKTIDELTETLQAKYNQELSHWVAENLKGMVTNV